MEHKTCKAVVLNTDEKQGVVECIFSVMGIVDDGRDVVHNGSFTKTWNERSHKIRLLDSHNAHSVLHALGRPLEFRELRRAELPQEILNEYPEATGGAWAKVQFNMKTAAGNDAFWHVHDGDTDEWSFGYDAIDKDHSKINYKGDDIVVRNLRTIKQYELSPVIFGMNEATTTTGAKNKPAEGKPYGVVEEDGSYCVYKLDAEGNPTGDRLGEHETEEEAEAQVRALYAEEEDGKGMHDYEEDEEDEKTGNEPESEKAGRVLSARNIQRIMSAMNSLHEALAAAGVMMTDDDDGPSKSKTPTPDDGAGPPEDKDTRLRLIEIELEEMEV